MPEERGHHERREQKQEVEHFGGIRQGARGLELVEQGCVGASDVEHRRREVDHADTAGEEQDIAGLRGRWQRDVGAGDESRMRHGKMG